MELSKKFICSFSINFFFCLFVWITNAMNMTRLRICPIIQTLSCLIFFFLFCCLLLYRTTSCLPESIPWGFFFIKKVSCKLVCLKPLTADLINLGILLFSIRFFCLFCFLSLLFYNLLFADSVI